MTVLVVGGIFREVVASPTAPAGRQVRLAGSALYAATAASRLGVATTLVAPVGCEDLDIAAALSAEAGVVAHLTPTAGASGTFAYQPVTASRRVCCGYRPAEGAIDEALIACSEVLSARIVLVFGHPEWDSCRSAVVREGVREGTLLFDRQGWMSRNRSVRDALDVEAVSRGWLANLEEVKDEFSANVALDPSALLPAGFDLACVKDGVNGVHVVEPANVTDIAAHQVDVVYTFGSGYVFAGALAAAIAEGQATADAFRQAAAAAAAAISAPSALPDDLFPDRVCALLGERSGCRPPR